MELDFLLALQQLHSPILDRVMVAITSLGNAGWLFIVIGILLLCKKETRKSGLHVLIALLLSVIICNVFLKDLVARARPCWLMPEIELLIHLPTDYSFPSGHTSAAFAAAVTLYMRNKKFGILMLVLAIFIAFSRMYLFVHFPTDVLGGAITGTSSAVIASGIVKKFEQRNKSYGNHKEI